MDKDKDGVPDHTDQRPTTSNRLAKIDRSGCYIMVTEEIALARYSILAPPLSHAVTLVHQNPPT